MDRYIAKEMLRSPVLKPPTGSNHLPTTLQSSPKSLALQLWALWEMDRRASKKMWAEIGGSMEDEDTPARGLAMKIEKTRPRTP